METLLFILFIGFAICFLIRHPLKTLKYTCFFLTFFVIGCIVIIGVVTVVLKYIG